MRKTILIAIAAILFSGCAKNDETSLAKERVETARQLVDSGKWNQAKIELDSVHILYPKQVAIRREAKALSDSIRCMEAERNLVYADSVSVILSRRFDELKKDFTYSRNEKYEDNGYYIHKKLYHAGPAITCLQATVDDNAQVSIRSYVTGKKLNHRVVVLKAGGIEQSADGGLYVIGDASERCEITTVDDNGSMTLLNFISSNANNTIQVIASGDSETSYQLSPTTTEALCRTYELAITLRDLLSAQHQIKVSKAVLNRQETKNVTKNQDML